MSQQQNQSLERPQHVPFEAAIRALSREDLIALVLMESRRRETVHNCGGCARLAIAAGVYPEAV